VIWNGKPSIDLKRPGIASLSSSARHVLITIAKRRKIGVSAFSNVKKH